MTIITANQFYLGIMRERDKYKLVNGGFIVKYIDDNICEMVGQFEKKGSVFNKTQTNKVKLIGSGQLFNKKDGTTRTSLKIWKKLNINFNEESIKDVLK